MKSKRFQNYSVHQKVSAIHTSLNVNEKTLADIESVFSE